MVESGDFLRFLWNGSSDYWGWEDRGRFSLQLRVTVPDCMHEDEGLVT